MQLFSAQFHLDGPAMEASLYVGGKIGRKEQLLLFLSDSFLVRLYVLVLQVN